MLIAHPSLPNKLIANLQLHLDSCEIFFSRNWTMLEPRFESLLRSAVLFTQRSTLYTTYYLEWDPKLSRVTQPKRNWHKQAFRKLNVFAAFFILPALWVRCYHLSTSRGGKNYKSTLCLTYLVSFILPCYLCIARVLMSPSGPQKYLNYFEVHLNLERKLEGW